MRTIKLLSRSVLSLLLIIGFGQLTACSEAEQAVKTSQPQSTLSQAENKTPQQNAGVVKSFTTAAGYTYIEVDISGDSFWLATAVTPVKVGDNIAWSDYAMMNQFKSKSLNREFDQILFVDRVLKQTQAVDRSHNGRVIEAINSAGYSYIHVEENGGKIWLAVPQTDIQAGQSIRWNSATLMRNFTSQSLNRIFSEIYFVSKIQLS